MVKADQERLYANTVVPLIKESGFPITLVHPNKGTYDPDTGYTPSPDDTSEGYAIEDDFTIESVPSSIAEKVLKVILAVEINKPIASVDTITMKGDSFQVLAVEPLETGEVLFYYTIYLGK